MTKRHFYSLTFMMIFGIFSLSSFTSPDFTQNHNNTFTKFDFENIDLQDTTRHRSQKKETYRLNSDGKKIYLSIVDGEIKKLKINGKKIPSSEYDQYADLIEEIQSTNDTPIPPTPPSSMQEVEDAHIAIAEAHEEIEEAHRVLELAHLELDKTNSDASEKFAKALLEDGLIKDTENFRIRLSKKKFKVNGKTQDKETHQKYIRLYEELTGGKMHRGSTYQISKRKS